MINIKWYDNTSVTIIEWDNGEFNVVMEGDNSHLTEELSTVFNQDWYTDYLKEFEKRKNEKTNS